MIGFTASNDAMLNVISEDILHLIQKGHVVCHLNRNCNWHLRPCHPKKAMLTHLKAMLCHPKRAMLTHLKAMLCHPKRAMLAHLKAILCHPKRAMLAHLKAMLCHSKRAMLTHLKAMLCHSKRAMLNVIWEGILHLIQTGHVICHLNRNVNWHQLRPCHSKRAMLIHLKKAMLYVILKGPCWPIWRPCYVILKGHVDSDHRSCWLPSQTGHVDCHSKREIFTHSKMVILTFILKGFFILTLILKR